MRACLFFLCFQYGIYHTFPAAKQPSPLLEKLLFHQHRMFFENFCVLYDFKSNPFSFGDLHTALIYLQMQTFIKLHFHKD